MLNSPLSPSHLVELRRIGYTVLPEYLSHSWSTRIQKRLSTFADRFPGRKSLLPDSEFLEFFTSDHLLSIPTSLFGRKFLFHHANGRETRSSGGGKAWHHDHDGPSAPRNARSRMYHVMVYPVGLPEDVAPLVVKPTSHLLAVDRHVPNSLGFTIGADDISIRGAPGIVVVLDSALWHMRPCTPAGTSRFDLNVSFCDPSGSWPERAEWRDVLREAAAQATASTAFMFEAP